MEETPLVISERMEIFPVSDEEMRTILDKEPDEEMKQAYGEMLAGCFMNPAQRVWYAVWVMRLRESGQVIGDLCFKGLNQDGSVEIGYGVRPEYEGKGYMTEAVTALCQWASVQPGVCRIEAETEPGNAASQRVLQKAGFVPTGTMGAEGPRFVWKLPAL